VSGWERITASDGNVNAGQQKDIDVTCTGTKKVLGGGYSNTSALTVLQSFPVSDNTWRVTVRNGTGSAINTNTTFLTWALCASAL
jgi:hypothetical protein